MNFDVFDTGAYNIWLDDVCRCAEELMNCEATTPVLGGIELLFYPYNKFIWRERFENRWLEARYKEGIDAKAVALHMAINTKEEWWKVLARKDESDD